MPCYAPLDDTSVLEVCVCGLDFVHKRKPLQVCRTRAETPLCTFRHVNSAAGGFSNDDFITVGEDEHGFTQDDM